MDAISGQPCEALHDVLHHRRGQRRSLSRRLLCGRADSRTHATLQLRCRHLARPLQLCRSRCSAQCSTVLHEMRPSLFGHSIKRPSRLGSGYRGCFASCVAVCLAQCCIKLLSGRSLLGQDTCKFLQVYVVLLVLTRLDSISACSLSSLLLSSTHTTHRSWSLEIAKGLPLCFPGSGPALEKLKCRNKRLVLILVVLLCSSSVFGACLLSSLGAHSLSLSLSLLSLHCLLAGFLSGSLALRPHAPAGLL